MAAQLTATNGPALRRELAWMKRARTSLPVPLSPVNSTVTSLCATRAASASSARLRGSSATGAAACRGAGLLDGAVGGHQQHRRRRLALLQAAQQLAAVHRLHLHVAQDQVHGAIAQHFESLAAVAGREHVVARGLERGDERVLQRPVVLDDENRRAFAPHATSLATCAGGLGGGSTSARRGRSSSMLVPRSGVESSASAPPCASVTVFTTANPKPVPAGRVEKNGSNTRDWMLGAMPGPLSCTVSSTRSPRTRAFNVTTTSGDA